MTIEERVKECVERQPPVWPKEQLAYEITRHLREAVAEEREGCEQDVRRYYNIFISDATREGVLAAIHARHKPDVCPTCGKAQP